MGTYSSPLFIATVAGCPLSGDTEGPNLAMQGASSQSPLESQSHPCWVLRRLGLPTRKLRASDAKTPALVEVQQQKGRSVSRKAMGSIRRTLAKLRGLWVRFGQQMRGAILGM